MANRERRSSSHWNPIRLKRTTKRTAELLSATSIGVTRIRIKDQPATVHTGVGILAQIAEAGGVRCRVASREHLLRGNGESAAHSVDLSRALVVPKNEQLVFDDGAADRTAELLPP